MLTSIPLKSILELTIHQLKKIFPVDDSDKSLINSNIGGDVSFRE